MTVQFAVAHVERFVVDEKTNQFAVGHVDHDLVTDGVAVAPFGVRKRSYFVDTVQIRASETVRISFIEISAPANMPIRERKQRLALRQDVEIQLSFAQTPRFDREGRVINHDVASAQSSSSHSNPLNRRAADASPGPLAVWR